MHIHKTHGPAIVLGHCKVPLLLDPLLSCPDVPLQSRCTLKSSHAPVRKKQISTVRVSDK